MAEIEEQLNLLIAEVSDLRSKVGTLQKASATPVMDGDWPILQMWGDNYSGYALGFSISGDEVTVNAGYLFHSTRAAITIAGDTIEIAATATYIYVEYDFGSGTATIESSTDFPVDGETTMKWLLYKVTLTGSGEDAVASIASGDIHWLGDIHLPSTFA